MRTNLYVEHMGNQIEDKLLIKKIKEIWHDNGNLIKDLSSVNIYYKVDEMTCYYIINDKIEGQFNI